MIKIVGLLLMIAATSGIGYTLAFDLQKRIVHMKVVKKMMIMLDGEITYAKAPLPEAFLSMSARVEEPFAEFLLSVRAELESFGGSTFKEVWEQHIDSDLMGTKLTEKDKRQLKSLGENMGYLDGVMQHNTICLYLDQLEQEIAEAESEIQTKSKVYRSLGVMAGLFLAVILI